MSYLLLSNLVFHVMASIVLIFVVAGSSLRKNSRRRKSREDIVKSDSHVADA